MAKNIVQLNIDGTSYTTRPYVVCDPEVDSALGELHISINELSVTSGTTLLIRFLEPVVDYISDEDVIEEWFYINNDPYNVSYNGSPCNPSFFKSDIIYEFYYDDDYDDEWKLIGQYNSDESTSNDFLHGIKLGDPHDANIYPMISFGDDEEYGALNNLSSHYVAIAEYDPENGSHDDKLTIKADGGIYLVSDNGTKIWKSGEERWVSLEEMYSTMATNASNITNLQTQVTSLQNSLEESELRIDLLEQQVDILKTILSEITNYNFSEFDAITTTTTEESGESGETTTPAT